MSGEFSIGQEPIGAGAGPVQPSQFNGLYFDPAQTIVSQYANSPVLLGLIMAFAASIDGKTRFDAFYTNVWNVSTAVGFGLDIWGRIVGIGRVLQVPVGGYLGFSQDEEAQPFGSGIFFSGNTLTSNFYLSDEAYRSLIMAKAAANITGGSIPAFNAILLGLFPAYGDSYLRDNNDMTMTIVLGAKPSVVDLSIIQQSGVLPKPAGVSFTVEHP